MRSKGWALPFAWTALFITGGEPIALSMNNSSPKRGRPPWIPTPEVIARAMHLASQGLTQEQIATALGICIDTLCRKKRQFSEFSEAIKKGQAEGIARVANALMDSALSGNVTAQIFYLKCCAGWNDGKLTDVARQDLEAEIDRELELLTSKSDS